jgi:hypothetical protein
LSLDINITAGPLHCGIDVVSQYALHTVGLHLL